MNKILTLLKDLIPLGLLTFALILIFVPIPIMLIQALIMMNIGFSLCLFLTKFFSRTMIPFLFPRVVLYFCVTGVFPLLTAFSIVLYSSEVKRTSLKNFIYFPLIKHIHSLISLTVYHKLNGFTGFIGSFSKSF